MINYSIIIPSRNLPDLLSRSLKSIPQRPDIQVIVVDDCSDPSVVDLASYPGLGIPGVEVIFLEKTEGAGHARNVGLQRVKGRWTLFMDCDDFFTQSFEKLVDSHFDDDADIVYFDVTSVCSEDLSESPRHLSRSEYFTRYGGAEREFCCRYLYTEPWGKMFKTDFLREQGILFEETPLANDFRFSILTGLKAGKVSTDPGAIYCVTERKGSLSNDFCSTELQLRTRLQVYCDVQKLLSDAGVKSYPFYKLVNFTVRHRQSLLPVLKNFCEARKIKYNVLMLKTLYYRFLFARYHRRHWAIF